MIKKIIFILIILGIIYNISINTLEKEFNKIEISSIR